jgi:phosphatidate cytidylyltransferase
VDSRLIILVGALFLAGAGLMFLEHHLHRPARARRRADWIKLGVFVPLTLAMLATPQLGRGTALILVTVLSVGGAIELYRQWRGACRLSGSLLALLLFLLALCHLLLGDDWTRSFSLAILLVATTDAFSQLWGRLIGVRKLCPRLSSGKTVEGVIGGVATAVTVATCLRFLCPGTPLIKLWILALVTSAAGISGDLLFSAIKRTIGIKDFSSLLPGNGGLLDRFDSLIMAAPIFHWAQRWLLE